MTQPTPDAPAGARRRADAMVGLFVGGVVALLAGITVLATDGAAALGIALLVVGVVVIGGGVALLRSISPEDRARLTAPEPDAPEPDAPAE